MPSLCYRQRGYCGLARSTLNGTTYESQLPEFGDHEDFVNAHTKKHSNAMLVDQLEMVQLTEGNYGTMTRLPPSYRSTPPSYRSPPPSYLTSDDVSSEIGVQQTICMHQHHVEIGGNIIRKECPQETMQQQQTAAKINNSANEAQERPSVQHVAGKLAAIAILKPHDDHVYECPKIIKREALLREIRVIAAKRDGCVWQRYWLLQEFNHT